MNVCPNKSNSDWIELVNKIGINQAYIEFYKNNMDIPDPSKFENTLSGINSTLKVVDALTNPKTELLFNRFFSNNKEKFYSELTQLAGKDQVELIRDLVKREDITTLPELVMATLIESSYTTQIKTAKTSKSSFITDTNYLGFRIGQSFYSTYGGKYYRDDSDGEGEDIEISREEYIKNRTNFDGHDSQHYANLTVPGGTNYTENEISTPQIEPSIKGHAEFSTKNGIGWFRSDDKGNNKEYSTQDYENMYNYERNQGYPNASSTKTRRVLEVQSDLFQKGRDSNFLLEEDNQRVYDPIKGYAVEPEIRAPEPLENIKKNQFLQLLNKDNNWVNFFVKSIIQDSTRKGYEEVHFPSGDTASRIEGHTTLEEHKKNIQNSLEKANDELKNLLSTKGKEIIQKKSPFNESKYYYKDRDNISGHTEEKLHKELEDNIKIQENKVKDWQRQLDNIETEGFAKLKPIYNFYENVLQNVLKKNYSIERVIDEHKNDWFKVKLEPKNADPIFLQKESTYDKPASKELDDKVGEFLNKIGVNIKDVKSIKDEQGNNLDANAVANLLTKTIDVVSGRAKLDTLPHEAAHFLLQILKQNGSPLYKSMLSEIESYDIYKQTLQEYGDAYKGNLDKIRDEAIARIIGQQIVDQFQQDNKKGRVATWFNRVINFIKEKLGLINQDELHDAIIQDNPFGEAASLIYDRNKDTPNFKFEDYSPDLEHEENQKFFQLMQPKQIEDKIKEKNITGGENGGRYFREVDGKQVEIKNRLSDPKEADVRIKSASEKLRDELIKTTGLKGHQDINNIVDRVVAERDGKLSPARVVRTDESTYNTLERYVRQMMDELPSDARIITNTPIYDAKRDLATTPSMMVINPDGKVDLYNWLFTTTNKQGLVNKNSSNRARETLQEQKKILTQSYGITKFGKIRTIPVETKFKDNLLTSIRTGDQTFKTSPELDPIPVSEELIGNEKLDRIITKLLGDKKVWEEKTPPLAKDGDALREFNHRKWDNLQRIDKAIRNLQLRQDVKEFINIGLSAIQEMADTPINQYSEDRIIELQKTMTFYGKDMLNLISEQVKDLPEESLVELDRLVRQSQLYSSNIETENAIRLISITGRTDLNDAQKQTGVYNRIFNDIALQTNPIIQSFWKLVLGAKTKTRKSFKGLLDEINKAVEDVKLAQPGISSGDLYNFLFDKNTKNGLRIASKYKKEFTDKLNESRDLIHNGNTKEKEQALKFIKDNTIFDKEAYEKEELEQFKFLENYYRNDEFKKDKISDRIIEFRKNNGDSKTAYANWWNPFVKIKDDIKLHSEEYKNIQNNIAFKNFYDMTVKYNLEFQDYTGQDKDGNYVWNIHNDLIDSIRENGLGAFTNMDSVLDHLKSYPGETLGMIDENTGKYIHKLPAYYITKKFVYNKETGKNEVDTRNQSKDMGKILALVGAMAYNHKYMAEIETPSKMLELALRSQPEIQTDSNGNSIKNKLTSAVAKAVGSANTIEQMNNYMNYYLYGVKNVVKDITWQNPFSNDPNKPSYSVLAGINLLSKWFVGKSLGGNPVSTIAHGIRGWTNTRIIRASGRFFNNDHYINQVGRFVAKDSKFFSIAGFFDLMDGEQYRNKAEKVSASKLNNYLNYDKLFMGHRATDYTIRNNILGAMLNSYTYNGETKQIERIGENDSTKKSLYDLIGIENDKLNFGNIPEDVLDGFRNKVQRVGDMVFGMNTRDAISQAHLNIFTRVLLNFRNWIPGMVGVRYGDLKHNQDLGEWELGRYRSFWNNIITKQFFPLLKDGIKGFGVFGYGGKYGDTTINHAKSLYANYMSKNPDAKISKEEYIDLHLSNMRANMQEVCITLAMIGAILAVKKEEGETIQQGSMRKYLVKQFDRSFADISFFWNPKEFNSIIKSPIPLTQAYLEPLNLLTTLYHSGETGLGISHKEKAHEARKALMKAVPGLNGFESLLSFIQDDYDKTKTVGTDSGSK